MTRRRNHELRLPERSDAFRTALMLVNRIKVDPTGVALGNDRQQADTHPSSTCFQAQIFGRDRCIGQETREVRTTAELRAVRCGPVWWRADFDGEPVASIFDHWLDIRLLSCLCRQRERRDERHLDVGECW